MTNFCETHTDTSTAKKPPATDSLAAAALALYNAINPMIMAKCESGEITTEAEANAYGNKITAAFAAACVDAGELCLPLHASEEMSRTLGAEAQLQAASAGNVELLEFVRHACAEDWLGIDAVGSGGRTPLFAACMALGGLRGARACFCHPAGWVGNALTDAAAPGPQAPGAGRLRTRFGMVPRAR